MEANTLPAINIAEIQKVIGEAPAVLEANTTSVYKALAVGNNLLKLVETDGMSDLMDSQMANYQAKVKVTIKTMNENRKGFTQLVDKLKKEFTSLESALDPINTEIQNKRDAYATKKINEQKERERVALLQKQKDIEKIEVKRQAEVKLSEKFQDILTAQKNGMLDQFESYTLETIDSAEVGIKAISEAFTTESFNGLSVTITSSILTKEEVASIVADVKSRELFASFNEQFKQAVSAEKRTMIDKLPSKKQELIEISKAGEEEKKRYDTATQRHTTPQHSTGRHTTAHRHTTTTQNLHRTYTTAYRNARTRTHTHTRLHTGEHTRAHTSTHACTRTHAGTHGGVQARSG